jgi:glutathione peroxidase
MADVLKHTVRDIDGNDVALEKYRGRVLLFVNLASKCGYTPQYSELEALHRRFHGRGFEVLGFPSNDFGAQEPGTEAEIKRFCSTQYDVTFPLFSKVQVKGAGKAPVYAALAASAGEPAWNFHKYLVGRDGRVVQAFRSSVGPMSPELTDAIAAALAG